METLSFSTAVDYKLHYNRKVNLAQYLLLKIKHL